MLQSTQPYQLIQTKYTRPPLDYRWKNRSRLIQQLNEHGKKRLTLISAPAGYGKTTLAVQWADQSSQATAWLSVDQSDSDSDRFLRYLVSAMKLTFPDFGTRTSALLSSPTLTPLEYLADTMIADLSDIDGTLSIIIDDFHSIADQSVQQIMIRIIQHLPTNLHLVILTRMDPPWPIGAFRGRGWINELRAADLRFSEDESQKFFNSDGGKDLTEPILKTLHHKTEGWIAGLQLAKLSIDNFERPEVFAEAFSGNDKFISDFLVDEVISSLPHQLHDFLAVTAMLDRFCAPLCDQLLPEGNDSHRLIEEVYKRNLFIVHLDNEERWFRYHHLIQTLLIRHTNIDQDPERMREVHFKAGKWFATEGFIEEALKHLLASGQIGAAVQLFGEHLNDTIQKDLTRRTLLRWMDMFPEETRNEHPALLMARICYLTYQWNFPSMLPLIDKAEIRLRDPACVIDDPLRLSLLAYVDALRGFYLYWQGDADGALRHTRKALEVLSREHSWAYTAGVIYKAGSLAATGQVEEALEFLSDVIADDCSAGSRNIGTILVARMAIHLNAGNLTGVKNDAQEVLKIHESVPVPVYWLSHAQYFLGSVAYEQNNLDVAADHFKKVEKVIYQVNSRIYHECLLGLALVSNAKHEPGRCLEYANQAQIFAIQMNDHVSRHLSESLKCRLTIMAGEPVEPISLKATNESLKIWLEITTLTLAEYLTRKPEPECHRALIIIDEALKQAKQWHNKRQEIQFLAVKSVALRCTGETDQALATLKETLRMAEPLGFVRAFVDRGPLMAELLNKLLNIRSIAQYVRRLLDAFEDNASRKYAASAFIDSLLTNRELKILEMLALRLTYQEIANNLSISPSTVKTHATRIYRKLNVSGRLQAIESAYLKGLVPEKK